MSVGVALGRTVGVALAWGARHPSGLGPAKPSYRVAMVCPMFATDAASLRPEIAVHTVTDVADLPAGVSGHPQFRLHRAHAGTAWVGETATMWFRPSVRPDDRPRFGALGDGGAALALVTRLAAAGDVPGGTRVELPRMAHEAVTAAFPAASAVDWDLRWLTDAPARVAGEERVVELDEAAHPEIDAVLDDALPGAHNRPGSDRIRRWYGIRDGADLVAVAADSSSSTFGFLNSIAVRSDRHGQGLGSALTVRIARDLLADRDTVMLGVWADNPAASRLYRRLGFTGEALITAFTLP